MEQGGGGPLDNRAARLLRRSFVVVSIAVGLVGIGSIGALIVLLDVVVPHLARTTGGNVSRATDVLRVLLGAEGGLCIAVVVNVNSQRRHLRALARSLSAERERSRSSEAALGVQADNLAMILDVAEKLAGTLDPDDVAAIVTKAVCGITGASEAVLWLANSDGSVLRAGHNQPGGRATGYLTATGRIVEEGSMHARPHGWTVRLVAADELMGLLDLHGIDRPASSLASLVEALATHAAGALEVNRRHARLRQASYTDPLTGLLNRAALEQMLRSECERAIRMGTPLAVLMVDVDHFKDYNDQHGHQNGDAALAAVGRVLAGGLRRTADRAFRYGGEEFVVVLPGTDGLAAGSAAERLRLAVKRAHESGVPRFAVTASFGVAALAPFRRTPAELVAAADAALYEAKRAGRDCLAHAPNEPLTIAPARPA